MMVDNVNDWKLDDNEWVKQRKKSWREYKFNIDNSGMGGWINVEKTEHKAVEKYFLTGESSALERLYAYFNDSLLLELWIHPSNDLEILKQVFERHIREKPKYTQNPTLLTYRSSDRNFLRGRCCYSPNVKFKGASQLNGRDILLDKVFMPQTLEAELLLARDEDQDDVIRRTLSGYCTNFEDFLARKDDLEYDVFQYKVPYWREAVMLGGEQYCERKSVTWLLEELDKIAANPDDYQPCQLTLAAEIEAVLCDPTIPKALQERVTKLRAATD